MSLLSLECEKIISNNWQRFFPEIIYLCHIGPFMLGFMCLSYWGIRMVYIRQSQGSTYRHTMLLANQRWTWKEPFLMNQSQVSLCGLYRANHRIHLPFILANHRYPRKDPWTMHSHVSTVCAVYISPITGVHASFIAGQSRGTHISFIWGNHRYFFGDNTL
jgi:hypothetical protein